MTPKHNGGHRRMNPTGAALVVGAGIAGMQAALDLAEAGIKVYLLDRATAIGGTMAQLDKTFPTNDCAMCIMSPKLVEVGRHLNIELLTGAELVGVTGEPGAFNAQIRQHPRYVDIEKCTGCGDCAAACPVTLPDEFNGRLSTRTAIFKRYPQAIPNAYAIEKQGSAPCRFACPVHQRAQGYIALIAEGRYADAYRTILEDNPFPSICGRVCNHRCEEACNRGKADEPVNVMALKRFVADWMEANRPEESEPAGTLAEMHQPGPRVAIVGAGPAGLACARDLVRTGCAVTVFEALPVAGGMMRVGVPDFRLPPELVQQEIDAILAEGVELRLNHRVEDVAALLSEYEAVFVAIGAHAGIKLPIPGNDLPGVLIATDFLRAASLPDPQGEAQAQLRQQVAGRRVMVLGGGNVAIDTATTAVRLGATWVGMACLEGREQMPAHEWEIQDAEEEGVRVYPACAFKEIIAACGRAGGVRLAGVNFRGFVGGKPDFDEIPGTEEIITADLVIFAIGQRPASECLPPDSRLPNGRLVVDPETLSTHQPGIFAGGDAVTGTAFIVDAIAAGQRAASSILAYLEWRPPGRRQTPTVALAEPVELTPQQVWQRIEAKQTAGEQRQQVPKRPADERTGDFGEVYGGLSEAQARAEALRCLRCGVCSECNQCVYACRADAIRHGDREQTLELEVGAVLLTPGLEPMPGDIRPEYGYGRYPNVITSLQFERMLSASGPFAGVVQRPSDGRHPGKVAWIQCVGSRDCTLAPEGVPRAPYCSSVCCMYATKEAIIAQEHDPDIEPALFYMDLRSFGKGFEPYIERAREEHGIRFMRCMVSAVKEVPHTHNLRLTYIAYPSGDGHRPRVEEEEFDLVVLSVGLKPGHAAQEMAHRLDVDLDEHGFVATTRYAPGVSSREGIFAAGSFTEPKDIPEAVTEASCTAAHISALLAEARGSQARIPEYPPERDLADEPVRVGVFVCHCGINIGGVVDVPAVVESACSLPGVAYAEHNLYTCSQDTQERIRQCIQENRLNRVVVASCTPRTHEPLFKDTLRQAGINPHLFEMANIREQDSWVHRQSPEAATEKARQLVAMAVAKAERLRPVARNTFEVDRRALVIGGGLAGMTAALSIARQGYQVYLLERDAQLGGHLRHIFTSLPASPAGETPRRELENPQAFLQHTIASVQAEARIRLMTRAQLESLSGYTGQYRSRVRVGDGPTIELSHGVVVVATGAQQVTPRQYLYRQHPRVTTQSEFEELLLQPDFAIEPGQTVVMIQCVGSRDEQHPYCSRICCTQAIKNALAVKQVAPLARVIVLYRDLRSYGFRELWYRQARQAGVIFLEYSREAPPEVARVNDQQVLVGVRLQPEDEEISLAADWLVLSAGIEPDPANAELAQKLKVPLNADGFFLEAHVKLRPVDFAAEGIFLAGLAHSPRGIDETITQAYAAAIRAVGLLSQPNLESPPIVAEVNPRLCAACGLCVEVCPYGARVLEPGMDHAEVIEVLCQGCGACVAACPNKASQQKGFTFRQVFGLLDAVELAG